MTTPESCLNLVVRCALSLSGLTIILCLWTLLNAFILNLAEEPRGKCQRDTFMKRESELIVELATDLRKVAPQESIWLETIKKYSKKQKDIINHFNVSSESVATWTLSYCLLFFYTFLTTFGLRQLPVASTIPGKLCVGVFTVVAIPLHIVIIMNFGNNIASKLVRSRLNNRDKRNGFSIGLNSKLKNVDSVRYKMRKADFEGEFVKVLPFVAFGGYYTSGLLFLGATRSLPFPEVLLFPLDRTPGPFSKEVLDVLFGIYHELGLLLAFVILALLKKFFAGNICNHLTKLGVLFFE